MLEQPGRVVRLRRRAPRRSGSTSRAQVLLGAEQGLLGHRLPPRLRARPAASSCTGPTAGATRAWPSSVDGRDRSRELLFVDQPEENHNGGQLAFGPDGRLYLGLGDGGGAFDPGERAQDPAAKLGKLLSVDVDAPHAGMARGADRPAQPVAVLVRPALGEIWIGDVGQDEVEEVNRVLLEPDEPPKNLGWDAFEGDRRTGEDDFALDTTGELVWPVAAYAHARRAAR